MSPEHRMQSRLRIYLKDALPAPGEWTSIDKGVLLSGTPQQRMHQAMKMTARGIKGGVSDVVVMYCGLCVWIELKAGRNSLQPQQVAWAQSVRANGFVAEEARSVVEVHDLLVRLGVPVPPSMRLAALSHDAALSVPEPAKKRSTRPAQAPRPTAAALAFGRAVHGGGV